MKKVLIVDDEESVQKILGDKVRGEGFKVESALDGVEALEKVKKEKPDLILLDIIMPKLDGISVLRKLKENPETDSIPVIILTNLSSKEAVSESLNAGVTDYLIKAYYTLDQLMKKIKSKI